MEIPGANHNLETEDVPGSITVLAEVHQRLGAKTPMKPSAGSNGNCPTWSTGNSSTTRSRRPARAIRVPSREGRARKDTWGRLRNPARPAPTPTPALRTSHFPSPPTPTLPRPATRAQTVVLRRSPPAFDNRGVPGEVTPGGSRVRAEPGPAVERFVGRTRVRKCDGSRCSTVLGR
jgi:hypothetical protein